MTALKDLIKRYQLASMLVLVLLLAVVLPLALPIFRLNLVGKYLTYAFVAIGLVMVWGYGGVLSLGQGVFFGLGGYAMAMFLKLEASDPITTKIQSTPGIPDFMDWNQLTELPAFWVPFKSLPFSLAAVVVVPTLLAWIVSFAMFKRRVGGVYFAIITQAVALILTVLIIGQQGYTGGVNGMTDLKTLAGWDTRTDTAKYILYYVCVALLIGSMLLCRWIQTARPAPCCWPCATRKTGCVFRAMTWPTSASSPSAWRRRSRALAARCSLCRWASCRPASWASCPASRW
jgi:urea transport system permease protein